MEDDEFLKQCFLGFWSDRASVMLGRKAGLYAKLKARYPAVVGWHCLNHRLELSVGDAVRSCVETNHFTSFLDKLYCLYSQSPKNLRELDEAASHFFSAGNDTSRTSAEICMHDGLAAKLSSEGFVVNLGLMLDALEELKDLSEALQNKEIRLSEGLKKCQTRFQRLKEKNPNMAIKEGLLKLIHTVDTLAVSTAEGERGFSAMNTFVSPLRNQLKIVNVSLMFVKLVGPPLELWNPTKFVRKWVMTRRSADHAACR
ncbi:E3 SUMO-protein ligase KIAA1586-like [Siphateles boraxobius]|uniref:E3 SUMO-protein ligase KIAA1586-like n=1 Tax=Siphateles boraxobius TaxID=180520 RepID=UPI004064C84D